MCLAASVSPDTATIWSIDLQPEVPPFPDCLLPENGQLAASILSPEEFVKASRFVTSSLRLRYAAAHVALRDILSYYLPLSPRQVAFATENMGKPIVDPSMNPSSKPLHFNLTHSEDRALVAIAGDPIGIDLEHRRPMSSRPGIDRQVYTPLERSRLKDASDDVWFDHWTAKESILKVTGMGFYLSPLKVELSPDLTTATAYQETGFSRWSLRMVDVGPSWSAMIATARPLQRIQLATYEWRDGLTASPTE
ncbi:MAG: 4'-phosphopantetheinyl transferase superfamily protein [Pirellulaceae bacterium]